VKLSAAILAKGWKELFRENDARIKQRPECPDLWVTRARLLMLEEGPEDQLSAFGLDEVERCILRALELDPGHLEAIEEAAHYYDVVLPDRAKAVMYAERYIRLTEGIAQHMQAIIEGSN
jgi:hypothetical protein